MRNLRQWIALEQLQRFSEWQQNVYRKKSYKIPPNFNISKDDDEHDDDDDDKFPNLLVNNQNSSLNCSTHTPTYMPNILYLQVALKK